MKTKIKTYNNMSVQAKAALWFAVCSILQKGISFITVPIFTKILTSEQYGTYNLYLSWLQILTIITSLYLFNGVFNNAFIKFNSQIDKYISSMQGLTFTITAICFLIYILFCDFWNSIFGLSTGIMLFMFMELLVMPAFYYWSGRQRFELKYKKLVYYTLLKSFLNPLLGVTAVLCVDSTLRADARIISAAVIEILFCGALMCKQFKNGKSFINKEFWEYALRLGIPLLPHYLSGMVLNQGDRIMIEKMVGRSEVAYYSVAYNIGMLVQIFTTAINNSFIPWMYQKIKKEEYEGISKVINRLLLLAAGIIIMLMFCSPELVLIFGTKGYAEAAYVIPPIAASVFFIFLYNLLAIPQFYFEKTKFMLISSIFSAIINIGLNYIFIDIFGYFAAGYTTLICYVLYSIGHGIVSNRVVRKNISVGKIYDFSTVIILSIVVIMFGIGCNFIFEFVYIRYALLFFMIALILLKRKWIWNLLGDLKN